MLVKMERIRWSLSLVLSVLILYSTQCFGSENCRNTMLGKEYRGTAHRTISGRTCQRWDSQYPHEHTRGDPDNFPEDNLFDAANYCRNPDEESVGPWCYTTDANIRWESCGIPYCEGYEPPETCKTTQLGREYIGSEDETNTGLSCQRWDSQYPHEHSRNNPSQFPDHSLDGAANFCRNPDKEPEGPWCYTTNHETRWQYCDIPYCDDNEDGSASHSETCKTTQLGREYIGSEDETNTGLSCQRWDSQYPHEHSRNNPSQFPDHSLDGAANFCRNPDKEPEGPWCYTTSHETRWQYCDIPYCDDNEDGSASQSDETNCWSEIRRHALYGNNDLDILEDTTLDDCKEVCGGKSDCQSFDYTAMGNCYLSTETSTSAPGDFGPHASSTYYEKIC